MDLNDPIISRRAAQFTSRRLAGKGMEMTPDQVLESVKESMRKLRPALKAKGFNPPDGDREMYHWLRVLLNGDPAMRTAITGTFNALPPKE